MTDLASLRRRLLSFIRRQISSSDDAEDLVQDVLSLSVDGALAGPVEDLTAYLFRATRNRIVDYYRKRSRHPEDPLPEILPDNYDSAGSEFSELIWDELSEALEELPPAQREAFVRNELEGESFREMSESTGISINTLLARKRYAVLYLRERLQPLFEALEE